MHFCLFIKYIDLNECSVVGEKNAIWKFVKWQFNTNGKDNMGTRNRLGQICLYVYNIF